MSQDCKDRAGEILFLKFNQLALLDGDYEKAAPWMEDYRKTGTNGALERKDKISLVIKEKLPPSRQLIPYIAFRRPTKEKLYQSVPEENQPPSKTTHPILPISLSNKGKQLLCSNKEKTDALVKERRKKLPPSRRPTTYIQFLRPILKCYIS